MAILLPIKKDSLTSKLCTSNTQPLTSHNAKNPSVATSLLTEILDSNLKKAIVIETKEPKENEITEQGTERVQKGDVQNSQNFSDDMKSLV